MPSRLIPLAMLKSLPDRLLQAERTGLQADRPAHLWCPASQVGIFPFVILRNPLGAALRILFILCLCASTATAQVSIPRPFSHPETSAAKQDSSTGVVEPGSPRASMTEFFALARENRWDLAARYLAVDPSDSARAPLLAKRLVAVLDRHLWVDLDALSPLPGGDPSDGLSEGLDQLGTIPRAGGAGEPIRIMRVTAPDSSWWVFTPAAVHEIDSWYGELGHNRFRDLFPESLQKKGPLQVQWFQWLMLLVLIPLIVLLGTILHRLINLALGAVVARTPVTWDDVLVPALRGPLLLFCVTLFVLPLTSFLGLNAVVWAFVSTLVKASVTASVFWALIRALGVIEDRIVATAWVTHRADVLSLAPLGGRLAKLLVGFLGIAAVMAQLNIPVTTLLAGLGIGGLAVALGAQKMLENVIGSIAIVTDKPFAVGDWIKVEDIEGTVEQVGVRSTRIRTFDRTVISYPNGRLADMRLESFSARDRFRYNSTLGLVYGTSAAQLRQIVGDIEKMLRANPKVWQDSVVVRLESLGSYALNVRMIVWFLAKDNIEFRDLTQEFLLSVMEIVERSGTTLAFPTQTLLMQPIAAATAAPARGPEHPTPSA
jgi:MscS family membrane protein